MYHNLFNYRPIARLNMYHLMFVLCQYFALHFVNCVFHSLACCVLNVFYRLFLPSPSPFFLISLLISWVQIDSKKQSNWNRCCLNNSMWCTHAHTHMYTFDTFTFVCLSAIALYQIWCYRWRCCCCFSVRTTTCTEYHQINNKYLHICVYSMLLYGMQCIFGHGCFDRVVCCSFSSFLFLFFFCNVRRAISYFIQYQCICIFYICNGGNGDQFVKTWKLKYLTHSSTLILMRNV